MSRPALSSRASLAATITAALLAATACGGGANSGTQAATSCPAIDAPELSSAIDHYLDGLDPAPLRFLVYASGDSALPDAARGALESKQPTYLFPTDAAGQQKQLAALRAKGAFPTMLVLYLGQQLQGERATIRLTGRYMDSDDSSKAVPVKAITFECRDRRWQTPATATSHST